MSMGHWRNDTDRGKQTKESNWPKFYVNIQFIPRSEYIPSRL